MRFLYYPIVLVLLILTVVGFFPVLVYVGGNIATYQWMLIGVAIYFLIRKIKVFSQNEQWLQTISHESSHAIVGMMFFHKIHSIQASENKGVVYHSGREFGDIFIGLAPYCLPVLTYLLLFMRILGANKSLYIFDIFIGFTLAFYIVCFYKQTRPYQTDIESRGFIRSYLFIITAWFFNATIILLTIRMGFVEAVKYIFTEYWGCIVNFWHLLI